MEQHIKFVMQVPFRIQHDEVGYIACCPPLDVVSQGETEKEAKKNLAEALQLFISSCYKRGTLDAVLKECGFTPTRQDIEDDTPSMDVPLHLVATADVRQTHTV